MVLPSGAALVRSFVFNVLRLSDPDDLDEAVHAVQPGGAAGISWTPLHVIPAWNPHSAQPVQVTTWRYGRPSRPAPSQRAALSRLERRMLWT